MRRGFIVRAMKNALAVTMLCLALSACAVVDLAAHGIKEYENSREPTQARQDDERQASSAPAPQPVIQQAPSAAPVEPVSTVPPRESVGVEPLR